jgi:acetolactate synthase-1/2/3 large subunit
MARMAESPIVLLSGDSPLHQDGMGAFQELDQISVSKPLTKMSLRSKFVETLGHDIATAIRIAMSGRPGPVHIALPFDLLNADADDARLPMPKEFESEQVHLDEVSIKVIADTMDRARRPIIITGPSLNASRAKELLEDLSAALDTPVITMESPRGFTDPNLGQVASKLATADVIFCLGKKIDFTSNFGKHPALSNATNILVVDPEIDPLEQARRHFGDRMSLACRANVYAAATDLIQIGRGLNTRAAWRSEVATSLAARPQDPSESYEDRMHPAELCFAVQRALNKIDDPILIVDGAEFGQWAQSCISAETRIINGLAGAVGGALCYALAAKIARPDATVVALIGDGSAGFHFSEFETACRYGIKFIAIIGHDSRWNSEYQIQLREYGSDRLFECELNPTRYDLAAAGLGCHGEYVRDPAKLDAALIRAVDSDLPVCFVGVIEGVPGPSRLEY